MKIIVTIFPTYLVTNFLLSSFLSFLTNQRQESGFKQVGGLVTRNISVLIDFYKGILLNAIPAVLIIVS